MVGDKAKLRKLGIVKSLPYHRMVIAHGLIERGADHTLLYFWYNLCNGNYLHINPSVTAEQVVYYIRRNPDFEDDIVNWFKTHEQLHREQNHNNKA